MLQQQIVQKKSVHVRAQMEKLEVKLTKEGVLVTEERRSILEAKPTVLLKKLKEGRLTAVQVLHAFQSKALEVTKRLNCVTEFIPEAEKWATLCDALPADSRGSLHGLPVSIKENIDVQGMDTTMGLAKLVSHPASSHAAIVETLLQVGAVPFCKTNVPQLLLSLCCSNPVYGGTLNPHDLTRTPGGSSGGEGALIGAGGSVLGIATDLGGSIRVPANFCGCVGIKPTKNRLSSKGLKTALATELMGSVGVMGRDVDIVFTCLKALIENEMNTLDPATVPIPWNELKFNLSRKLVFGYFESATMFPTSPGVKRAIQESKLALEQAGHEVIPFEIPDLHTIFIDMISILSADGGQSITIRMKNEIIDPTLEKALEILNTFNSLKPVLKWKVKSFYSSLAADAIQYDCVKSSKLWEYLSRRSINIEEITRNMKKSKIDLILSPGFPIPAPQPCIASVISPAGIYNSVFNYLDFPSGCVPVTKENEMDQLVLEDYPEEEMLHRIAKAATRGGAGLPIGVLISGLPWNEELVIRGMLELQEALKSTAQQEFSAHVADYNFSPTIVTSYKLELNGKNDVLK